MAGPLLARIQDPLFKGLQVRWPHGRPSVIITLQDPLCALRGGPPYSQLPPCSQLQGANLPPLLLQYHS